MIGDPLIFLLNLFIVRTCCEMEYVSTGFCIHFLIYDRNAVAFQSSRLEFCKYRYL